MPPCLFSSQLFGDAKKGFFHLHRSNRAGQTAGNANRIELGHRRIVMLAREETHVNWDKAFGVKTGTRISDARVLCPGIAIVESKPPEYIRFHNQIIAAVENCIHVEAVLSIDEMWA